MKIYIETLGCARNQVDGEMMAGQFARAGFTHAEEPEEAEIIVINTCGFIEEAINESIDTILYLAEFKQKGVCRLLVVAGCLTQRFGEKITADLTEVDLFLGTGALDQVPELIKKALPKGTCFLPDPYGRHFQDNSEIRRTDAQSPFAYLKIAEGCDKHCTYCIIPALRGKQKSRPMADIVKEAQSLIQNHKKEIILVAQETTFYGRDLEGSSNIADLLDKISILSQDIWIRLLYGHPESVDENLIRTMASHENICPYFDIPIQHASDGILKRMGRNYKIKDLYRLVERIRKHLPEAVLRTTVITGFPGETRKDFNALMSFIREIQFDHLGAFVYSDFDDLPSHRLKGFVSERTAKRRQDEIMACQRDISTLINRKYQDRELAVLIEESPEPGLYMGRTVFQAPEVDGITYVRSRELDRGAFTKVRITDTLEYDLIGEPA
ncbi:MAG: 30S ribosomal protein S12 methylthiotransferase RimO [Desulfobacteraceae bacterium]|nr:30S ribosomal protein S12 methylthiotransferase RimO [Desulfobacteraceae bacterium]